MKKKSKNENFIIPKKAMAGIASIIAICAVLFSKNKAPEVLLFMIGVGVGIFIGYQYYKEKK